MSDINTDCKWCELRSSEQYARPAFSGERYVCTNRIWKAKNNDNIVLPHKMENGISLCEDCDSKCHTVEVSMNARAKFTADFLQQVANKIL